MANCNLCGLNAGWFRDQHKECLTRRTTGWKSMVELSQQAASEASDNQELIPKLHRIAERSFIDDSGVRKSLIQGWEETILRSLGNKILSEEEEAHLIAFANRHSLSETELDNRNVYTNMLQIRILREVESGEISSLNAFTGECPFNLQRSEKIIWVFPNVSFNEVKTRRQRVGGSQGVSVRVMNGVYYRTGQFQSRSVESTSREYVGDGTLGVTTKHIYFSGEYRKFRVPYTKIVAFDSFSNGFGITRDTVSAKPQTFVTGDEWFAYHLVVKLSELQS